MSTGSDMREARACLVWREDLPTQRLAPKCVGAVQRRLLPSTAPRSLGTHEFMTLVTPLSIEALNAATVHDKDGTATSLANLFTGNKTLVLVLRHCL